MTEYDDGYSDGSSDELDLTPPAVGAQYHPAETETVLLQLRDLIENARPVPLSASAMISKDEVLDLVDEALQQLPEELRAAKWLLKERVEYVAKYQREADEIVAQARARAERMVQRAEVVAAAEQRAYEIVDTAEADARRLRHEVEDFCDQKLASFEIVLERTQKLVTAGRAKLQGTNLLAEAAAAAAAEAEARGADDTQYASDYATEYADDAAGAEVRYDADGRVVPDEYAALSPTQLDAGHDPFYDAPEGSLPFDQAAYDEPASGSHLTVVDDRYADLPPPPAETTIRDAAATFFDQDLA